MFNQLKIGIIERIGRTFGHVYTPLAAMWWTFTLIATAVAFLPFAYTTPIPLLPMQGLTLHLFLVALGFPNFAILMVLNGLSSRWGPISQRSVDEGSSRWGYRGMQLIVVVVLALRVYQATPLAPVDLLDFSLLLTLLIFGWYDYNVNQGEHWRSTFLQTQEQGMNLSQWRQLTGTARPKPQTQLAQPGAFPAADAAADWTDMHRLILAPFYDEGVHKIGPLNKPVYFIPLPDGGWDVQVDMTEAELVAAAAAQLEMQRAAAATPVAAAP